MKGVMKYPVLEGQIAARGLKKTAIAARIGCTYRAFTNKCNGTSQFTWSEVQRMSSTFFPDMDLRELMRTTQAEA